MLSLIIKPFRQLWLKPFADPRDNTGKQSEADREIEREWRRRVKANEARRKLQAIRTIERECGFFRKQA